VSSHFLPRESFRNADAPWHLLPFSFVELSPAEELLVNEVGEYAIVPRGTARRVVERTLDRHDNVYAELRRKQFLWDGEQPALLALLATKWRTRKRSSPSSRRCTWSSSLSGATIRARTARSHVRARNELSMT